jgi:hypothetical protein
LLPFDTLGDVRTLREQRELYRYAGWLSIILGWLSHDLGHSVTGQAYCLDAWEHGWQAETAEICTWAMDASATIALYSGDPNKARQAAAKGLSQAPADGAGSRTGLVSTRPRQRPPGPLRGVHETLATTRTMIDRLDHHDNGLFSIDAGRISSYAATSMIWLGHPAQAVTHAREAITFYQQSSPAHRSPTREAIAHLDEALALTDLGDLDTACSTASLALATGRITGSVLTRAGDVDANLTRCAPGSTLATAFHDHYRSLRDQHCLRPSAT